MKHLLMYLYFLLPYYLFNMVQNQKSVFFPNNSAFEAIKSIDFQMFLLDYYNQQLTYSVQVSTYSKI